MSGWQIVSQPGGVVHLRVNAARGPECGAKLVTRITSTGPADARKVSCRRCRKSRAFAVLARQALAKDENASIVSTVEQGNAGGWRRVTFVDGTVSHVSLRELDARFRSAQWRWL